MKKSVFYLHWWNSLENCPENKKFIRDFLKDYLIWDKILFIPFGKENYAEGFARFKNIVSLYCWNQYDICLTEDDDNLIEQINISKYIYIAGGDFNKLTSKTQNIKNLKKLLNWKIVAWSSAWTNLLSTYCYSNDYKKICRWLGVLNIMTVCHYKWLNTGIGKLAALNANLPIYRIKEKDYFKIIC